MSFESWFDEDKHDLWNFPIDAMREAFNEGQRQMLEGMLDCEDFSKAMQFKNGKPVTHQDK